MMKQILTLGFGALALAATPAAAQPAHAQGKGKAKHAHVQPYQYGYGQQARHCPPGLAKKNPQCMPPGQYKKLYNVGHRFPVGYDRYTPFNQIPYDVRRQYRLDPYGRYIYDNNYVYRVDPTTRVVSEVLRAIIR